MSGRESQRFFDSITDQSRIKHFVYESYLIPWTAKLGSTNKRIWIVDAFAGPGRYHNGAAGSPKLALDRAKVLSGRTTLSCIFAEKKDSHRQQLRSLIAPYVRSTSAPVSAQVLDGDFWSRSDQIPQIVRDEPVLLFVDPFGLRDINFERLSELCAALPRVDVIVNLRSRAAYRLRPTHAQTVSRAVGSTTWSVDTVGLTFRSNLKSAAAFLMPASLGVKTRFGGAVQTELILASRHPDAYALWNDQIAKAAESLPGYSPPEHNVNWKNNIAAIIRDWASTRMSWTRKELIDWFVVEHCGEAHTGVVKQAVVELLRRGEWRRLEDGPIDSTQLSHGQRALLP